MNMSRLYFYILFSGLFAVGLPANIDLGCEPFWTAFNGNCYRFLTHRTTTRKSALSECNYHGANLLRIEDMDEMAFVNSTLYNIVSSGFWTDMTDLRFDGTNVGTGVWWWGQYEPIDMTLITWEKYPSALAAEVCGALNQNGFFQNWNCSLKFAYICEYALPTSGECSLAGETSCIFISNSSDYSDMHTWQDAKATCQQKFGPGAQLVSLDNAQDYAVVTGALSITKASTKLYWTGLVKKGTWSWDSGATVDSTFVNWAVEPNHFGNNGHCGVLKLDGTFIVQDCSQQFNYACKKTTRVINSDYYFGCGGWQRAGKKCYMFYDSPWSNWEDARANCLSFGGDLLHVTSMDERIWLESQMMGLRHPRVYWTGLNDLKKRNFFAWADGTPANNSFIRWNSEPNSFKGDEDCVVILDNGALNDEDCLTKARVVCEYSNNQNAIQCPTNWIASPTGLSCYYVTSGHPSEYSWDEAYTFCTKIMAQSGGTTTLVAINSQYESDFITGMLSKQPSSTRGWWTGLNDRKIEGIWQYPETFNKVDLSLLNWGNEPRPSDGIYDCGLLMWGGRYFNRNCSSRAGFICERMAHGLGSSGHEMQSSKILLVLSAVSLLAFKFTLLRQGR